MKGFDGPLVLRDEGVSLETGAQLYSTTEPVVFRYGLNGSGLIVNIPAGFVTDLASTPRILWPVFPPTGVWNRAAVLHDYLCEMPGCSRFLADAVFREAMSVLGVPVWRRLAMYYAVRLYAVVAGKR